MSIETRIHPGWGGQGKSGLQHRVEQGIGIRSEKPLTISDAQRQRLIAGGCRIFDLPEDALSATDEAVQVLQQPEMGELSDDSLDMISYYRSLGLPRDIFVNPVVIEAGQNAVIVDAYVANVLNKRGEEEAREVRFVRKTPILRAFNQRLNHVQEIAWVTMEGEMQTLYGGGMNSLGDDQMQEAQEALRIRSGKGRG